MGWNLVFIFLTLAAASVLLMIYLRDTKKIIHSLDGEADRYELAVIIDFVKETFNDVLKTNLHALNLSREEFENRMTNRAQLRKALKTCSYGDLNAKNYIKYFIRDILMNIYHIDGTNIDRVIPFHDSMRLSVQDKFEVLVWIYKKQYKEKGLERLFEEYRLAQGKWIDGEMHFIVTAQEIEVIYPQRAGSLSFDDKLEILIQRIYQCYKGYGVIDEIRDMAVDGVSGGVSGMLPEFHEEQDLKVQLQTLTKLPMCYDSVWVFYKGRTLHLSFLSFGSEKELMRVCKNIYRYNNPGQLSESNGYKVNEMKDGSRVVVARPPFSESWVFFIRKFDSIQKANMSDLIVDEGKELAIELIKWLIKGCRVTAVTGSQGTGKTTLLMSMIQYISPTFTLRIQEMSFELHLRKIYPKRNIVTFRETGTITGQEGLNLQKKTDGTVNILGEVAEASVASLMIQMAQVASLFTLFTHHAKTAENLVSSIRNNLLQTGVFSNEQVAEQQVAQVINFDIHLNKTVTGHRYIERITEIVPLSTRSDYPTAYKDCETDSQRNQAFMDTMQTFFTRMTDRKSFETRDILRFEDGRYTIGQDLSRQSIQDMSRFFSGEELSAFQCFMTRWGGGHVE